MLHINDADQPATPADENKKQEQEELEPLPWEVGKGFLWGLPKTAWLVVRCPRIALCKPYSSRRWTGLRYYIFLLFFAQIIDPIVTTLWVGLPALILGKVNMVNLLSEVMELFQYQLKYILLSPLSAMAIIIPLALSMALVLKIAKINYISIDQIASILSYASTWHLFDILPILGLPVALIGMWVSTIVGIRHHCKLTTTKAWVVLLCSPINIIYTSYAFWAYHKKLPTTLHVYFMQFT